MKATELLEEIRENLKDYPIEYLRNKVTDDRYKDPLTKSLAKYNSEAWDEIFALNITMTTTSRMEWWKTSKMTLTFISTPTPEGMRKQGNLQNTSHFTWH